MTDLAAFLAFAVWGVGMVVVYGFVLWKRHRTWLLHHDRRSKRDLMEALGLFLVAIASAFAVFAALFDNTTGLRVFLAALVAGALLGVGLLMATEPTKRDPAE